MDKFTELAYENVRKNETLDKIHFFDFNGETFIGLNKVFSPIIYKDSFFFAETIPVVVGGAFLEIGCGTGLVSVYAAKRGFERVVASDINSDAVINAKLNAVLHKIEHKVSVFESDIFDNLSPSLAHSFDVIFWNTPFLNKKEVNSLLERSVFGDYTQSIERYIANAKSYLKENGRLLLGISSTCGDMDALRAICAKYQAGLVLLATHPLVEIEGELYEITFG